MHSSSLLSSLPPGLNPELEKIKSRQLIYRPGMDTDYCHIIVSGHVKLYDLTESGAKKTVMILGPDDGMPLVWAFDHVPAVVYYYEALSEIEVVKLDKQTFKRELTENPDFCRQAQIKFVYHTWDLIERVKCLQMVYTFEKLLRGMPYIAAKVGVAVGDNRYQIPKYMTQEEIAWLLGTSRESISAHFGKLKEQKVVENLGQNLIFDLSKVPDDYIYNRWFDKQSEGK